MTGISSGIGWAIAQLLIEQGFRVFGTARETHGVKALAGVDVVELDVTNSGSIEAAVKIVLPKAGLP